MKEKTESSDQPVRKLWSIQVDQQTYDLVTAAARESCMSRKAYVARLVADDFAQTLEGKPR